MIHALRRSLVNSTRGATTFTRNRVQSHLSLTPSEMMELAKQGIPVSSHFDDSKFNDGDSKSLGTIDIVHTRGIDVVDAWNYERDCRRKLMKAHETDVANYD